jgi:uncharacterized paraquat-inducible protein A
MMFCPKCGSRFEVRDTKRGQYLYCSRGDMGLARKLQAIFERRYVDGEPQPPRPDFSQQIHGFLHRWYCPGCGIRLDEHGVCPRCRYHLRDLVYPLVETHGHKPVEGSPQ